MAFAMTEILAICWWLMMRILRHFNDIRINRLREIENELDDFSEQTLPLVKHYRLRYGLSGREMIRKLTISPMKIYTVLLLGYTAGNIALLCTMYLGG
jgi:hypothetical protein